MWQEVKQYWLVVLGLIALIAILSTMCSGPKKQSFNDKAQEFCKSIDSTVTYSNEEKKLVICN